MAAEIAGAEVEMCSEWLLLKEFLRGGKGEIGCLAQSERGRERQQLRAVGFRKIVEVALKHGIYEKLAILPQEAWFESTLNMAQYGGTRKVENMRRRATLIDAESTYYGPCYEGYCPICLRTQAFQLPMTPDMKSLQDAHAELREERKVSSHPAGKSKRAFRYVATIRQGQTWCHVSVSNKI